MTVAVTSAGGRRPVVVLPGLAALAQPLARAGFMAVVFEPRRAPAELRAVLDALERGALGVVPPGCAIVTRTPDGALAVTRVAPGAPGPDAAEWTVRDESDDQTVRALVRWLTTHAG